MNVTKAATGWSGCTWGRCLSYTYLASRGGDEGRTGTLVEVEGGRGLDEDGAADPDERREAQRAHLCATRLRLHRIRRREGGGCGLQPPVPQVS